MASIAASSSSGMKAVCMWSMAGGVLGGVALAALAAHVPALTPSWCRPAAARKVAVASSSAATAEAPPRSVFVLLVQMKLNAAMGGAAALKAAWAALAEDVRKSEPNCLSYELCEDVDDPNSIIIYERYLHRSDLEGAHNSGAVFKAFGKRLGEGDLKGLVVSKSKSFFVESNVGFMTRA